MSNVACNGSESALAKCDAAHIPPDEGREVYMHVNVAGVSCSEIPPSATTSGIPPSATTSGIPHSATISGIPPSATASGIPTTSGPDSPNYTIVTETIKDNSYLTGLCITVILLVVLIVIVIRYTILHHILQQIYILDTHVVLLPICSSRDLRERETFMDL